MRFGQIGNNIYDQYSPLIHELLGNSDYTILNLDNDELDSFFAKRDFEAVNVSSCYQERVLQYCDEISPLAKEIGAANVILKREDGTLFADNTESAAFKFLVENNFTKVDGKQCFVLGTGGTSLSVRHALLEMGAIRVLRVSRHGMLDYVNFYDHVDADIIINASPVGECPDYKSTLINVSRFQRLTAVYDLICYPSRTQIMLDSMVDYIRVYGGLLMLVKSCAESYGLFTGNEISDDTVIEVYKKLLFNLQSIILIGFEGCGSDGVGRVLSTKLNRELIDFDTRFKQKYEIDREKYLKKYGDVKSLQAENGLVNELAVLSGKIIVFPGELMSPKDNRFAMKRNATVVWLERNEELQKKDGVSVNKITGHLKNYIYRQPLYIESSDFNFSNNGTAEECADKIISTLQANSVM